MLLLLLLCVLFYVLFCCYSYALDLLNHRQQSIKSYLKEIWSTQTNTLTHTANNNNSCCCGNVAIIIRDLRPDTFRANPLGCPPLCTCIHISHSLSLHLSLSPSHIFCLPLSHNCKSSQHTNSWATSQVSHLQCQCCCCVWNVCVSLSPLRHSFPLLLTLPLSLSVLLSALLALCICIPTSTIKTTTKGVVGSVVVVLWCCGMLQAACHKLTTHRYAVWHVDQLPCNAVQLTVNCSSTEISDEDEDELGDEDEIAEASR